MTRRILAVILAGVVAIGFSGCGKGAENLNQSVPLPQSTASSKPASVAQSSVSTTSESSGASDVQVIPQQEKIPLTEDELDQIYISYHTINFFKPYEQASEEFDFTESISDVKMLDYIFDKLSAMMLKGYVDFNEEDYESGFEPDNDYVFGVFHFTCEKAEKLIQKHFLPNFMINSVDYTKSEYWDQEEKQFNLFAQFDRFTGDPGKEYYYYKESGYKIGDYYYINLVPLADYPNIEKALEFGCGRRDKIKMAGITSEFFDIPRVCLKVKKFSIKDIIGETGGADMCVGLSLNDDRPDWVEMAEKFYKDNDLGNNYMIGRNSNNTNSYCPPTAGVISTPFGKRMYLYNEEHSGSSSIYDTYNLSTFGTRGQNDELNFSLDCANVCGGFSPWVNTNNITISCNDVFSDKKYVYNWTKGDKIYYGNGGTIEKEEEVFEETWKLNDKEISERKFNSADVVSYFYEIYDEDEYGQSNISLARDLLYSCDIEKGLSLADYYEICRILFE